MKLNHSQGRDHHYSSEDLLLLAEDRVPNTNEIFIPNSWYGFAKAIKDYSKWPFPLPFVVPHGVDLGTNNVCETEMAAELPAVYCYQSFRRSVFERRNKFWVINGCSPWLYFIKNKNIANTCKAGTIVFPPHSTSDIDCKFEKELEFIEALKKLPPEMHPISICLYWKDIQLGRHHIYINNGFPVSSAGHMNDDNFSDRLYKIFSKHEYLFTSIIGSHIFYGATAGLKVILDESHQVQFIAPQMVLDKDLWFADKPIEDEVYRVFNRNPPFDIQRKYAFEFLGGKNMLSPFILFCLIGVVSMRNLWILKLLIHKKLFLNQVEQSIKVSDLKIEDWGSRCIEAGNVPNIQPNGHGAFWVRFSGPQKPIAAHLFMGDIRAGRTEVQGGFISATFPSEVFSNAGIYEISLRSGSGTLRKKIGDFSVLYRK
ncbi:hypothetical protein [Polynucleobacter sp. UB-Raua-W9]|uniref:hypothetical protein n=1 Tax=Polynucleobacter sp. UB-Raua-W9 TaxID=1819736 RepID=UPI001BFD35C7|nr:hypothetical protein [Polynucleobacter sp. UB-Raua-W9]QWD72720.1 hypothetical protein AOC07_01675 [Polynucleobacter sp. UB-Raua-W9]